MATTPRYALTQLVEGQAQGETTANTMIALLEALASAEVLNSTLSTPPGSPVNGDVYIVAASPTGAWTGQAAKVAVYLNGWQFFLAKGGMLAFDKNAKEWLGYSSAESAWHPIEDRWSATEHWTGKYREGSKVYSKVVDLGTLASGWSTVAHGISSLDLSKPVAIYGTSYIAGIAIVPIPATIPGATLGVYLDATNVNVYADAVFGGGTAKVRIEYFH